MKKKSTTRSAFFNLRVLVGFSLSLGGILLALLAGGAFSNVFAQPKHTAKDSFRLLPAPSSLAQGPSISKSMWQRIDSGPKDNAQLSPADAQGRFVYLIKFAEPGMLQRRPHVSGEPFKANTPEAIADRDQIVSEHAAHVDAMSGAIGRSVNVTHHFLVTHSGIATRLTPEEAKIVQRLPGVASVERERLYHVDTFRGPAFIGADQIWNGSAVPGGVGTRGQGIVIAMLDTGLDPAHPAFANDAACGHGVGGAPNKLISFLDCSTTDPGGLCNGPNPVDDTQGHGTHTSSTAGGNTLTAATSPPPTLPPPFTFMSGVAPCANIRSYKVCGTDTCGGADIQAGMNSVLLHGDPKVMNFSISGGNDPWSDNDRKKLDLVNAGVVVAASAGNTSASIPDPVGQVAHLGPWVLTVAASTKDQVLFDGVLSASGPGNPPPGTQNIGLNIGSGSPEGTPLTNFPIRHFTGQDPDFEGCNSQPPFPANFFNGAAALIRRGNCTFVEKITNAFNAGAAMVVIRNRVPGTILMNTDGQPSVPAYSCDQIPGDALAAFVDANPSSATVNFTLHGAGAVQGDVLADFSLRGPVPAPYQDLTKPDITNPGVIIYAAWPLALDPFNYSNLSGTSMSSPHTAGCAALVRAVHPTWSPPEVKSALMMTAFENGHKENGTTPWDTDDVGNGRADLTKAARAGLVMNETFANFLAADPNSGGDEKTLNIASVRNVNCITTCTWTRTVRNTRTTATSWTASGMPISSGFNISVQPTNFSFTGSLTETQVLTITATPTTNLTSAVAFGKVALTATGGVAPDEHITVAIKGSPTGATPTPTPTPGCPTTITQSNSQTITAQNSVSCNDGSGHHSDSSYWRAFNMNNFVGGVQYDVTSVSFGIENATAGSGGSQPVTVRLHANNGSAFPGGMLTQIGSASLTVPNQTAMVFSTPLTATVPAGTLELVMEVFTPSGMAAGNIFFIGSNALGQTGPGYISSADCGIATPTNLASIGFPNMHMVMNVNGSCAGGASPTPTPTPTPVPSVTPCLAEGFDNITTLVPAGWFIQNNSQPVGTLSWFQGSTAIFTSQSGAPNSYIGVNFQSGAGTATLSNWLLTPALTLQNGGTLTFYTRTVNTVQFPDRLQVRMSTNGSSTNVGTTATDIGDFTTLLLDINPTYTLTGYPNTWTQFTVTLSGISSPTMGRLAFRYFVEQGGPNGDNSEAIGIDTLQFFCSGGGGGSPTPTPTPGPSPGTTPIVNVGASQTHVTPGGSVIITVSCGSPSAAPLTINYTMAGKARLGRDYSLSGTPGQITIPAGETSAQITLQSLANRPTNKVLNAKLVLQSGPGYNVGTQPQIKIRVPKKKR